MKKGIKHKLKIILPLALGVFLVWYSYAQTTPDNRALIIQHISEANYLWVGLSLLAGLISHVSRAVRWNLMLEPLGHRPHLGNNIMAILIAYLANLGIPRSGEVFRATSISTYEKVPFNKAFGTIVAERVIDLAMLFIIIFIATLAQTEVLLAYFSEKGIDPMRTIAALAILGFAGIAILYYLNRSNHPFLNKFRKLIRGLTEGLTSIFRMRKKGQFLFHTLLIWALYIGMFWLIKFSIPETSALSLQVILVAFVAGALAMSTTNGGIGIYPLAVSKILVLYGISQASGDAFGWIMWTSQTLMVVVFGAISFLYLPVFNRNK